MDIVVRPERAAVAGTDVPGTIRFRAGGSAANTARSFAALGGAASFIGAIGNDELGGRLTAALHAAKVTVHAVRVPGPSARLLVLVSTDGERSFITDRGVADDLPGAAVKDAWLAGIDALHVPAYSLMGGPVADASFDAIRRARDRGVLISIDLASVLPLLSRGRRAAADLLRTIAPDILFGNTAEMAALLGPAVLSAPAAGKLPAKLPEKLLDFAPLAVVKQGPGGCLVLWRGALALGSEVRQSVLATRPLAVTDTTGAGDAFDAGFLHALIASGYRPGAERDGTVLGRAALAGHRAAARTLTAARKELFV